MNLFQLIAASPTCTALLGTDPVRCFEFGTAPQLMEAPYMTWQELQGTPFNYLSGAPTLDALKIQIDVWAPTAHMARQVSKAIRLAIHEAVTVTFFQNTYDEASRLYRVILHIQTTEEI